MDLQGLISDILFADYPAQSLIMPLKSHMISVKVHESKRMFLQHYFSDKLMEPAKRHKGAQKTVGEKERERERERVVNGGKEKG